MVTFGRASNTAPITPTGTRRSNTRSPDGRVRTKCCRGGSGVSASTSSCTAMSASRSGVRRRRSSRPPVMPPRSAASTSAAFAASRSSVRSRSAAAMVCRAASTAGPPAERTPGAAAAARWAARRTAACSGVSARSSAAAAVLVLTPARLPRPTDGSARRCTGSSAGTAWARPPSWWRCAARWTARRAGPGRWSPRTGPHAASPAPTGRPSAASRPCPTTTVTARSHAWSKSRPSARPAGR